MRCGAQPGESAAPQRVRARSVQSGGRFHPSSSLTQRQCAALVGWAESLRQKPSEPWGHAASPCFAPSVAPVRCGAQPGESAAPQRVRARSVQSGGRFHPSSLPRSRYRTRGLEFVPYLSFYMNPSEKRSMASTSGLTVSANWANATADQCVGPKYLAFSCHTSFFVRVIQKSEVWHDSAVNDAD